MNSVEIETTKLLDGTIVEAPVMRDGIPLDLIRFTSPQGVAIEIGGIGFGEYVDKIVARRITSAVQRLLK